MSERIILDKDKAADFGQMIFDIVHTHANFSDATRKQIEDGCMVDAYINEWQNFKMREAGLKLELEQLRTRHEQLRKAAEEAEPLMTNFCKASRFFSSVDANGFAGPFLVEVHNAWLDAVNQLRAALADEVEGETK